MAHLLHLLFLMKNKFETFLKFKKFFFFLDFLKHSGNTKVLKIKLINSAKIKFYFYYKIRIH